MKADDETPEARPRARRENAQYRTHEGQLHDVGAKALAPVLNEFFGIPGDHS